MPEDQPISLWDTSATERVPHAPLDGDATCDLAIVGGGFTGLSAALRGAELGLNCHVLEAEKVGFGGSGRNVGLVNAGVWLQPAKVMKLMGNRRGGAFLKRFGDGPQTVFDMIEKHQIRCEATRGGTLHAADSTAGLRELQARFAQWQAADAPVTLLSASEMQARTGSHAYLGGLHDARAGTVNPMGYCRGLARAAIAAGARISTETRATALHRDGDYWQVVTPRGTLRARHVILGTNAYTDTLWPGLDRVFMPIHYFQLASPPLGPEADDILPGGEGLWTTAQIMTDIRRDAEGRLLVGSMGTVSGNAASGLSRRWATKLVQRLFPQLGPVPFDIAWHGRIAMTPDHLPCIFELAPGLMTAIGYNGRGITTGTIMGTALAEYLATGNADVLPVEVTSPRPVFARGLRTAAYQAAFSTYQAWRAV